jgi:hypothetical protein
MIAYIPEEYDLCLTYTYGPYETGMTGHIFECIEYYYILKKHFKPCIMIPEATVSKEYLEKTIRDKYVFTNEEVCDILDNILIFDKPKLVRGKAGLIVDAGFNKLASVGAHYLFDKVMVFPCDVFCYKEKENVIAFQDDRIYGTEGVCESHHYIKKILLDKYKPIGPADNKKLIYATKNARGLKEDYYTQIEKDIDGEFLLLTNAEIQMDLSDRFHIEEMPVQNLMEKFDTYVYTPIEKKWDCSPRFIVECKYYGKNVEYYQIDYLDVDHGLRWRIHDIEHNYDSLFLREDDEIIKLVGDALAS